MTSEKQRKGAMLCVSFKQKNSRTKELHLEYNNLNNHDIKKYCDSLTTYSRRLTREVRIGDVAMGGQNPIRIQSMTTVNTMDTEGSVLQVIRMVDAGCEYVRITAPSVRDAENLREIKKSLQNLGVDIPLIADIHFTPNAAEVAARIVEKVRINPGNYADKKKFLQLEYTDGEYEAELQRIREKFTPLVNICKEYGTALRIGTNHGSLSDRIMSRYGDTPMGMVESALEFLRICDDLNYHDIVLSMKASNPKVMVQAYRLLVNRLEEEEMEPYPLHLGVTEAGEAEDGRIKSAVGIGALLEDGLGDTIRVSLTEEPEKEVPVAKALALRYEKRAGHNTIPSIGKPLLNPFEFMRRKTQPMGAVGGLQAPIVIADFRGIKPFSEADLKCVGLSYLTQSREFTRSDRAADFIYTSDTPLPFSLPREVGEIIDYGLWVKDKGRENRFPCLEIGVCSEKVVLHPELNFITADLSGMDEYKWEFLKKGRNLVVILRTSNKHAMPEMRRFFFELINRNIQIPVIVSVNYSNMGIDDLLLYASTDVGGLLVDGLGDGIMLNGGGGSVAVNDMELHTSLNDLSFGILQAAGARITKTEYISCPSCGRTLFDLQEATAKIRERTAHLKGVKIGIMGCIVNGPGEMADADYGYVGSGKGKITLYRGQEVVKRGVPEAEAVNRLIEVIKEDGKWVERN